ncbi:MAG: hypothetical protein ABFC90_01940 [Bacteroidales bacterium]|nr:hypothetical protein [Bacteroidales bacterium]
MEKVEVNPLISFSRIFPDSDISIDDVIRTLPSKKSIEWISYFLILKYNKSISQPDYKLFKPLLSYINIQLKKDICSYIQKDEENDYGFIDNVALLILLDKLLTVHNDNINELSETDYSNLMIAYLMCCDKRISLNADIVDAINENMDADSFVRIYLSEKLKYYDIEDKDIRVEFIRSMMFKDFCEKDNTFQPLFKLYLDRMNISNWEESKFFIIDLINRIKKSDKHFCGIKIRPDSYMKKYLDAMSVDMNKYRSSSDLDFKDIRDKPIYYQGDNKYHILSFSFLIDKLYQGFLFDFAAVLKKEKEVKEINSYPDLKQRVGDLFSEKYLFYAIMKGCFEQTCDVRISGQELEKCLKGGEPDYYLRKGKNIFLFEFKDVMLNAKTKHCNNFDEIVKELLEQFERSTEEKSTGKIKDQPKGITQLLNVIEKKLDVIIERSDKIELSDDLNVFPIIIYQDCNFDIEGINYILNNRFHELLKSRNIPKQYIIKKFVMFSLTTLIQLEDFFSEGKLDLEQIIMDYFTDCSLSERNKTTPFEKYILRYAKDKGYNQENTKRFNDINNSIENKIIKQTT